MVHDEGLVVEKQCDVFEPSWRHFAGGRNIPN